ncbi:MAG TPA: YdeI/OmpD-associated family protein [Hyphomicrobium sp.]|nr:YdeI/OmpD-associated family protein [Hyphomicrobium sp.]
MKKAIPAGVVHELPPDLRALLIAHAEALDAWVDLTPLARNEWICWILAAKKPETRTRKIARIHSDLLAGKRRPCCWPGCSHRS